MTPPTETTLPPAARWSILIRHGLFNFLVCCGIGVWLAMLAGGHWLHNLVYSQAIGMLCWLLIDAGRLLAARQMARRGTEIGLHGWPGWGVMSLIILFSVPLAYVAGSRFSAWLLGVSPTAPHGLGFMLILSFTAAVLTVGFRYTQNALLAARTEAETVRRLASETQLKLLQSQLEPHMLFNTLANLRVLIGLDPPRAQQMLDHLIAFLRATLQASRRDGMEPLQAEFARLDAYLALLGVRMGERLHATLDLPAELRDAQVPPLLLQPLVENSIRHGLEPKVEGGRIEVQARAHAGRLILTVRDSGVGLPAGHPPSATDPSATPGTSFGLDQARERLAAIYGSAATLSLSAADDADGGTLARIELPLAGPPSALPPSTTHPSPP